MCSREIARMADQEAGCLLSGRRDLRWFVCRVIFTTTWWHSKAQDASLPLQHFPRVRREKRVYLGAAEYHTVGVKTRGACPQQLGCLGCVVPPSCGDESSSRRCVEPPRPNHLPSLVNHIVFTSTAWYSSRTERRRCPGVTPQVCTTLSLADVGKTSASCRGVPLFNPSASQSEHTGASESVRGNETTRLEQCAAATKSPLPWWNTAIRSARRAFSGGCWCAIARPQGIAEGIADTLISC